MKSIISIGIFVILIFSSYSCNDDSNCPIDENSNTNTTEEKDLFLKSVSIDGLLAEEYSYDTQDRIEKVKFYKDGELDETHEYEYLGDTIRQTLYKPDGTIRLIYEYYVLENGNIRKDQIRNGSLVIYYVYEFDGDACGYDNIYTKYVGYSIEMNKTFQYTDGNCSFIATQETSIGQHVGTGTLTKDEKNDAYQATKLYLFGDKKEHNDLRYFYRDGITGLINTAISYSSDFDYNKYGYPVSQTRIYSDGTINEHVFEYYD